MSIQKTGNARKKQLDYSDGPWTRWKTRDPAERAIRFIQTYCRPPKGFGYGQPMRLADFQVEWIRNSLAPGVRASVMSLPRGNGKSTLLAGFALWALFDKSESGAPQVPIVATNMRQAERALYDVAVNMINAEPELANRCLIFGGIGTKRVEVASNGGSMFVVSNNVDGLQGLDPSVAVLDEIGFSDIDSWNALTLASGKRPRSLVVGIGTPGYDHDNALWHVRSRVVEGRDLPGFTFTEYAAPEGCDLHDEDAWLRANPAIAAGFADLQALRNAAEMTDETAFRILRLGQWYEGANSWLGPTGRQVWDSLADPYDMQPGAETWVGIDMALSRDCTAVVIGQRRDDGRLHFAARIWWPRQGEVIDTTDVMQHIRDLNTIYNLQEVVYDRQFFEVPAIYLADERIPMVQFPQSNERMSPAYGSLYEAIQRGEISHNGDQAFTTQVLNGVQRFNTRGWTLQKGKSKGKIDAAVAMMMCFDRMQQPVKPSAPLYVGWA